MYAKDKSKGVCLLRCPSRWPLFSVIAKLHVMWFKTALSNSSLPKICKQNVDN